MTNEQLDFAIDELCRLRSDMNACGRVARRPEQYIIYIEALSYAISVLQTEKYKNPNNNVISQQKPIETNKTPIV